MRRKFADYIYEEMKVNKDIYVLTADLGYKMWDTIRDEFPDRFYNVGSAEQLMLGIAIGLAQNGKIPICYSITSFLIFRPFELIKLYLDGEKCPAKLVGSGYDNDYERDGVTHRFDSYDLNILQQLENIEIYRYSPMNSKLQKEEDLFKQFLYDNNPSLLILRR